MKDCTTCKYGYEDERLGIPMCHHPKRFSEDCVDFNMHEEKEIKESEKPVPNDLEEAAEEYRQGEVDTGCDYIDDSDGDSLYHSACLADAFIAGAKWQAEKDKETIELAEDHAYFAGSVNEREQMMKDAVEGEIQMRYSGCLCAKTVRAINEDKFKLGDKVRIIVLPKED